MSAERPWCANRRFRARHHLLRRLVQSVARLRRLVAASTRHRTSSSSDCFICYRAFPNYLHLHEPHICLYKMYTRYFIIASPPLLPRSMSYSSATSFGVLLCPPIINMSNDSSFNKLLPRFICSAGVRLNSRERTARRRRTKQACVVSLYC